VYGFIQPLFPYKLIIFDTSSSKLQLNDKGKKVSFMYGSHRTKEKKTVIQHLLTGYSQQYQGPRK
jgi:hypothetical protein